MKEKDIITDILDRVEAAVREFLAHDRGFEETLVEEVTRHIRAQDESVRRYWRCSDVYVPAKSRNDHAARRRALEEVSRTGRVGEAAIRHGISRSTMYRLLRTRPAASTYQIEVGMSRISEAARDAAARNRGRAVSPQADESAHRAGRHRD